MGFGSMIFIGQPCCTHHNIPGETRSLTLSAFAFVMTSPDCTCAPTGPVTQKAATAAVNKTFPTMDRVMPSPSEIGPGAGTHSGREGESPIGTGAKRKAGDGS